MCKISCTNGSNKTRYVVMKIRLSEETKVFIVGIIGFLAMGFICVYALVNCNPTKIP